MARAHDMMYGGKRELCPIFAQGFTLLPVCFACSQPSCGSCGSCFAWVLVVTAFFAVVCLRPAGMPCTQQCW